MGKSKIDLCNKRFGRLVAIKPIDSCRKHRSVVWKCRCDCGKECDVSRPCLVFGNTKSCGCLKKESTKRHMLALAEKRKLPKGIANFRATLYRYRDWAKKRGFVFELTEEQFMVLTQQDCHYCGIRPQQVARIDQIFKGRHIIRNGDFVYNGIDRIDNTKGYTFDNCVTACKICNYAKRAMTAQAFYDWIGRIWKHNSRRINKP
jgi:hypothetical protein